MDPNELIMAHFNIQELKAMDEAQGGESFVPVRIGNQEVPMREYSKLGQIIDDPEVQEIFREAFTQVSSSSPSAKQEFDFLSKSISPPRFDDGGAKENPIINQLSQEGTEGDSEVALVPLNFVKFLDTIAPPRTNPTDGLREYFGWTEGLMLASLGLKAYGAFQQQDDYDDLMRRREEIEKRNAEEEIKRWKDFLKSLKAHYKPSASVLQHEKNRMENPILLGQYREPHAKGGIVYKKKVGTFIKGPGKGQDDKIYTRLKPGDHVVDCSSVSDLGDGASDAGDREIKKFARTIDDRKYIGKEPKGYVDVALSNKESVIPVTKVMALGKGDPIKGSHLIDKAILALRLEKRGGNLSLPPKAKSFSHYIKNANRILGDRA